LKRLGDCAREPAHSKIKKRLTVVFTSPFRDRTLANRPKIKAPAEEGWGEKEKEKETLERYLSILEPALAQHHGSDECLLCRTKASIEAGPSDICLEENMRLLKRADSNDRRMILKHHEPSACASQGSLSSTVYKVDIALVKSEDLIAWKLRVYQVSPKDPAAPDWAARDPVYSTV
jgi:hypothetical protein